MLTLDRFHHQQFCLEAVQEVRIALRRAEILARSKYLLMMSPDKWTDTQKERAAILFNEYPEIEKAYSISHSLRMIFSQRCTKEEGRASLQKWYSKVTEYGNKAFNNIAAAMYDKEDEILNYSPAHRYR